MPIRNKALFIEPELHKLDYASCVAREVEEEIAIDTVHLRGDEANPSNCTDACYSEDPIHVWGVGHGNPDVYTVECTQVWLDARIPSTLDPLIGRTVHLLSCSTGANLGPALIEHGSLAYWGYNASFGFLGGPNFPPCCCRLVRCFHSCDLEVERSLARGRTTGEAFDDLIARFNEEIAYWEESDDPNAALAISILEIDRDRATFLGDGTITITERGRRIIWPYVLGGASLLALPLIIPEKKKKEEKPKLPPPKEKEGTKKLLLYGGIAVAGIALVSALWPKPAPPPPGKAYINVYSTPTGADVLLNGTPIGTTPISHYEVDPGSYTLQLTKVGYEDYTEDFTISEGETRTFDIVLNPVSPPSAEINEFTITA